MPGNPSLPALPCPDCALSADPSRSKGLRRIGHNRATCSTCNAFVREVARLTLKEVVREFPDDYTRIRLKVEADLYPSVISRFAAAHPVVEAQREASVILTAEVDDTLRALAAELGVES
jgi:hypothetical protein